MSTEHVPRGDRTPADDDALADWLLACLDEDQRVAEAAGGRDLVAYLEGGDDGWAIESDPDGEPSAISGSTPAHEALANHIARWDPARVLADIQARRGIIGEYEDMLRDGASREALDAMETAIEYLALAYTDRSGFKEEWRP